MESKKVCAITLIAVFLLSGCGEKSGDDFMKNIERPVKTMVVTKKAELSRSYPGKIQAANRVELSFHVSGHLIELPVKEGQEIKKGDLLARIDSRDYKNALDTKKAEYDRAEADFNRFSGLFTKKIISELDFDKHRAQRDVAKSKFDEAQKNFDYTSLYAPFAGIIGQRYVENFQDVQAKQPVLSLQDISEVDIVINIPEKDIATATKDTSGRFVAIFDFLPENEFALTIKEFAIKADPATQTFKATLTMLQPKGINAFPGMTVNVKRYFPPVAGSGSFFVIPFRTIVSDETGGSYVWVVDKSKSTVRKRKVVTGNLIGSDDVEIKEGLSEGDEIVVAGISELYEGMKVNIANK